MVIVFSKKMNFTSWCCFHLISPTSDVKYRQTKERSKLFSAAIEGSASRQNPDLPVLIGFKPVVTWIR